MEKIILLILAMVLTVVLSACELKSNETTNIDDNSIENTPTVSVSSENTPTVPVSSENTPTVPVPNDEWDTMLLNCDNKYFVVKRTVETYNSLSYEVGVVDKDNNWICEPSSSNSLAECITNENGKVAVTGQKTSVGRENFYYLGNGVVVASLGVEVRTENGERIFVGRNSSVTNLGLYCYFYNIEKNKSFYHNANSISTVIDGYIIVKSRDWSRITDTGENEMSFVAKWGPYSEGLFLGTPDSNWYDDKYGFYDINGNLIIDLSEYDLQDLTNTKFINGYCNISFKNPAGNIYYATIDKNGNFVREPSKDESILEKTIESQPAQINNHSAYHLIQEKTLTVAVNATFEPFMYKDDDKIVGFEADLIECIASEMGLTVKYKDVEFDSIIDEITNNKADVGISLMAHTYLRKKNVDFSDEYLIDIQSDDGYAIAVGKNKNLLSDINAVIKKLINNGTINKLKQKYNIT